MKDCMHSQCTCRHEPEEMVKEGERHFCSQTCADQDPASGSCECGHPQCDG